MQEHCLFANRVDNLEACDANRLKDHGENCNRDNEGKKCKYRSYQGTVISSDPTLDIAKLLRPAYIPIPLTWATTSLPLALLPLEFLIRYVQDSSKELTDLASQVLIIENEVVRRVRSQQTDFKDLIERLNDCSANTVKLHRRWHFQHTLAETIDELVKSDEPEDLKSPRSAQSTEKAERIALNKKYPLLVRRVAAQQKLIQSIKYDLEVLPRRISNQSTAVRLRDSPVMTCCASSHTLLHRSTTSSRNAIRKRAS